uniref:Uncharacterized protein n=1 Tax=Setaria digitata TaxID=48799 RepID=A0A915PRN0_9BILA
MAKHSHDDDATGFKTVEEDPAVSASDCHFSTVAKTTLASILKNKDELKAELLVPKKRTSITFGFATAFSPSYQLFCHTKKPEEDTNSIENYIYEDSESIRGTFLIPAVNTVAPIICEGPAGHQADAYIQNLPSEQFELIRKFVERNDPKQTKDFLWIQDNTTSKITILNMENFRKNMKAFPAAKHVSWQDLSLDEINICRYSAQNIPITSVIHCFTHSYFADSGQAMLID